MRYIIKQNGNYYFRRKITKTNLNFTFSLKTKNVKIAIKKVSIFLKYTEYFFKELKFINKEEIMDNIKDIQDILHKYEEKALEEYSELEEKRHNHFTCTKKNGKVRDGGHPKCIKKWLKTLKEATFAEENSEHIKLFEKIFQRTGIDKNFYKNLSEQDKKIFRLLLLKTEAQILKTDHTRAKERFGVNTKVETIYNYQETSLKDNKYHKKTAQEIAEDFIKLKKNDTKEIHKYTKPIDIFLQVVNKKYLIDVTAEDIQDFVFTIKNMPPESSKENKELIEKYKDNYYDLAKYINENNLTTISYKTAQDKIKKVKSFLDYATEFERLDKNRLDVKYILPNNANAKKIIDKQKEERKPFNNKELSKLFNNSSWYNEKIKHYYEKEQDRFYIPLIGLLSGMRLNEIAQLYIDDIKEENGIYYFRVDETHKEQKLKNLRSKRRVPIHSKLIEFGFLKYINKLIKENKEERVFPQLYYTTNKGYGQAFSKKFNNKNFKKLWIDEEKLNNPKIKVDFHSFRHTFASKIMGKIEDSILNKLLGHAGSSENQKTYSKEIDISELKKAIEMLDIKDIDFSNIQKLLN